MITLVWSRTRSLSHERDSRRGQDGWRLFHEGSWAWGDSETLLGSTRQPGCPWGQLSRCVWTCSPGLQLALANVVSPLSQM